MLKKIYFCSCKIVIREYLAGFCMFVVAHVVGHFICSPECSLTQEDALTKGTSLPFRPQVSLWFEKQKGKFIFYLLTRCTCFGIRLTIRTNLQRYSADKKCT